MQFLNFLSSAPPSLFIIRLEALVDGKLFRPYRHIFFPQPRWNSLKPPEVSSTEAIAQTFRLHRSLTAAYRNRECLQDLYNFRSELLLLLSAGLPDKKKVIHLDSGESYSSSVMNSLLTQ